MRVCKIVLRLQVKLAHNPFNEIADLPIAAHLTRKPTLKPDPLPVDVKVPLELCAVALDAGLRPDVDGDEH
jgi:hypothetical protein